MVKITTRQQFELLIKQMEENQNIARGVRVFGETKANTDHVWDRIAEKLNSCGPPTRTTDEWQRVWIHFKAKLKKKMSQNKRNLSLTGGGPSQEVSLSSLEQAAADLLQIGLTVNPVGNIFGVLEVSEIEQPVETEVVEIEKPAEIQKPVETDKPTEFKQPIGRKKVGIEERKASLLKEQIETQTELLNTLKKIEKNSYRKN